MILRSLPIVATPIAGSSFAERQLCDAHTHAHTRTRIYIYIIYMHQYFLWRGTESQIVRLFFFCLSRELACLCSGLALQKFMRVGLFVQRARARWPVCVKWLFRVLALYTNKLSSFVWVEGWRSTQSSACSSVILDEEQVEEEEETDCFVLRKRLICVRPLHPFFA